MVNELGATAKGSSQADDGSSSEQNQNHTSSSLSSNKTYRRTHSKILRFFTALNYPNIITLLIIPLFALYKSCLVSNTAPLQPFTLYFSIFYYCLSISLFHLGYHRYFSHRSFTFHPSYKPICEVMISLFGSACGMGSILQWVPLHRAHHRYVDTEKDPSYIRKGLFFAHIGHLLLKKRAKVRNSVKECQDEELSKSMLALWQDENYYALCGLMGFAFPSLICGIFGGKGDYYGGLIYAGVLRMFFVQQSIMLVDSLGHLSFGGVQPYDDRKSHRDNLLLSILSFGEGYNNFHHEFSSDYRNGLKWYSFDPIKYQLQILHHLGVVSCLNSTPSESIKQVQLQQAQKLIDRRRSKLNWGVPIDQLPLISPAEFKTLARESYPDRVLIAVAGIVHDVSPFVQDHPGGVALIQNSMGKDATSAFNGAVYDHSIAAHNLLATMRIAVLSGKEELQVWQKQTEENVKVPLMRDSKGNRIVRSGGQDTIVKSVGRTADAA